MISTIGRQVTALALVSIVGVVLISFGLALLTPTPTPRRMTVEQAAAALGGQQTDRRSGMTVSRDSAPPSGRESEVVSLSLARLMRTNPANVRAVWIDKSTPALAPRGESLVTIAGKDAVVDVGRAGFVLFWGKGTKVQPTTPLPPFSAAVRQADGGWLAVAPTEPLLSAWRLEMLGAFLLSASLVAPFAWLVGLRITRPMRALANAAAQTQLDGPARASETGPAEVRAAAAAINAMRDRLARETAERTRMLAAVAHDLRNPLTGIRLRAESAPEDSRAKIVADVERMEAMIDQVLDYVRGREVDEPRQELDVSEVFRSCAEEACERGQEVRATGPLPRLVVRVGPEGLRRALANLIDNAVRYGRRARLTLSRDGACAVLGIADEGAGLDEAQFARIVEPFQRIEESRNRETGGAGLGLAIVDDFARRHGGRLVLSNMPEGGLLAQLRLPLA